MGWLWLVGALTLWVSFAEYRLFYRALLQKRPIILRSLLIVATPYQELLHDVLFRIYYRPRPGHISRASPLFGRRLVMFSNVCLTYSWQFLTFRNVKDVSRVCWHSNARTPAHIHTHARTHTLSLSLSHTHTQTYHLQSTNIPCPPLLLPPLPVHSQRAWQHHYYCTLHVRCHT